MDSTSWQKWSARFGFEISSPEEIERRIKHRWSRSKKVCENAHAWFPKGEERPSSFLFSRKQKK